MPEGAAIRDYAVNEKGAPALLVNKNSTFEYEGSTVGKGSMGNGGLGTRQIWSSVYLRILKGAFKSQIVGTVTRAHRRGAMGVLRVG
ncbi:hypothetical protein R1flu_005948 [Riccia fluitans]|uniref:Uncharacterized protein n=1 Tax=Riccia fluitans TaxID=41844 RepID=A0ABD1YVJ5_9MARC